MRVLRQKEKKEISSRAIKESVNFSFFFYFPALPFSGLCSAGSCFYYYFKPRPVLTMLDKQETKRKHPLLAS
jgi:hypothetical protein